MYSHREPTGTVHNTNYSEVSSHGLLPDASVRNQFGPTTHYSQHRQNVAEYSVDHTSPWSPTTSQTEDKYISSPVTPSNIQQSQLFSQFQIQTISELNSPQAEKITLHTVNGVPIYDGTQVTDALVGAKFVQPTPVDWQGQKTLMFVFSDLAVKTEGLFILRYRTFDIFSRASGQEDLVIQAECYGGPFKVYSTKEFPGLQASTELTKLIARYGVRLNIRETERKRRKKVGGKRKYSSDGEEDEDDYEDAN
ncbi:hypothetical protein AAF712_001773 [Marasmius tenuissimus]|uniref:Velvet domain-containing protein n=1 Tax=Marasmius tenuissimus TaxID=585030 RepID=A0ABR3AB58_9AGAR